MMDITKQREEFHQWLDRKPLWVASQGQVMPHASEDFCLALTISGRVNE
ncbi:Uncharacterised protein [Yersinia kristensenii]|nr:hypothetical protein DJ57_2571 [Yersinia rochesterensis]CRY63099.1 Uncharacterised protein [Yersinia kristensenii]